MERTKARLLSILSLTGLLCVFVVSGCGGGERLPVTVLVTPATAIVLEDGTPQTFTATVTNGSGGVTWSVSCSVSSCGTLSGNSPTSVIYTPPGPPASTLTVTLTATSVADTKQTGTATITVPAITVAVSPGSPSAQVNTALQFSSTVGNTSSKQVTWSLTQVTQGNPPVSVSPCSPGCGTLTDATPSAVTYNAPSSLLPAMTTVTITAKSVTDTTKSGSSTIIVTSTSAYTSKLSGQYAFLFNGFDDASGKQVAISGSLTADGKGAITGGVEDINGPATSPICLACPQLNVSITGTYSIGADNRGTLSITNSVGTTKYAIALGGFNSSGVATTASLIEFDDTSGAAGTRGSGVMLLQDSTAFSQSKITGAYAFGFSGQDSSGKRIAEAGRFDADGAGNLKNGLEDVNDSGTVTNSQAFTGTYTAPDTNGRATGTLTAGGATTNFVFYVASAKTLLLETTDAEVTAGLKSGEVLSQTSTSFTSSSLSGNAVFEEAGIATGATTSAKVTVGVATFTSASTSISVAQDENDGGTINANASVTGITYSVSANGRVASTVTKGTPPVTSPSPVLSILYLVDTNKGFALESSSDASLGTFEAQSAGPLNAGSIFGNYFVGTAPAAVTASSVSSGMATANGVGTVNVTTDNSSSNGTLTAGQTQSFSYSVSSNGRTAFGTTIVGYLVSPTKFVLIDVSTTNTAPTVSIFAQ